MKINHSLNLKPPPFIINFVQGPSNQILLKPKTLLFLNRPDSRPHLVPGKGPWHEKPWLLTFEMFGKKIPTHIPPS